MNRGKGLEEVDEAEVEEKEEEDGVSVRGGEGVFTFRPRRGTEFGEAGGVNINCRWNEPLDGRGRVGGLAAPFPLYAFFCS